MDEAATSMFNERRKKHFPLSLNFIDAHLTLFHALPNENNTLQTVEAIAGRQKTFKLQVTQLAFLGRGVAYKVESNTLMQLHKSLQHIFVNALSLQDKQKRWPHITIQNKVSPAEAQALLNEMQRDFSPFSVEAKGLQIWEYLNGPWKFVKQCAFKNEVI